MKSQNLTQNAGGGDPTSPDPSLVTAFTPSHSSVENDFEYGEEQDAGLTEPEFEWQWDDLPALGIAKMVRTEDSPCLDAACGAGACADLKWGHPSHHPERFIIRRVLSITVDTRLFASPQQAYAEIIKKNHISKLINRLKIRKWIIALDFQNGWPCWRIAFDLSTLPSRWYNQTIKKSRKRCPRNYRDWSRFEHYLDLNKAHKLLREWRVGGCHLSLAEDNYGQAAFNRAAANAIAYSTTTSKPEGYPEWLQAGTRMIYSANEEADGLRMAHWQLPAVSNISRRIGS